MKGITIWIWGSPYGNREHNFHMGNKRFSSLFPYSDSHMETGIVTYPYGNGESLFPYGESKDTAPHFHMRIPIWKWGLTHPHMEMGNLCFHMGNLKKQLPVSIQGSPYGNGD
jgi:hypothetical protein